MFNLKIYRVETCVSCSAISPPNPCLGKHISMDLSLMFRSCWQVQLLGGCPSENKSGFCSWVLAHQLLASVISWRKTFNCSNIDLYGFHSHCHRFTFNYLQAEAGLWLQLWCQGSLTDHRWVCSGAPRSHTLCTSPSAWRRRPGWSSGCKTWRHKLILERKF